MTDESDDNKLEQLLRAIHSAENTERILQAAKNCTVDNDGIPPHTHRDDGAPSATSNRFEESSLFSRIVQFFITDLLSAESEDNRLFTIRGITFRNVKIRGRIVDYCSVKNYFLMTVDDGTDKIDCYYEKEIMDKVAKNRESIDNLVIDKKDCLKDDETDDDAQKMATDKTVITILSVAKRKLKEIPLESEIELGDTVEIIGKLSKYDDRHTVFVKHIVKKRFCDANSDITYKNSLLDLYENYYLEQKTFVKDFKQIFFNI